MTLSFTAMSDKWRRVSGAKVQQIIDMDKEKGIYLCKNPFFLSISFVHFSHAREKEPKSALPPRPPSKGDATAPPVALTLMYPRPITGSG